MMDGAPARSGRLSTARSRGLGAAGCEPPRDAKALTREADDRAGLAELEPGTPAEDAGRRLKPERFTGKRPEVST